VLAIVVGAGMALSYRRLVPTSAGALPPDAVARVNDAVIRRDDFERALDSVASDRRTAIDDAQRRHVLDRLIDEELLVQHALRSGVLRSDARVRADLVASVVNTVTAEHDDAQPDDAALAAFYEAQRERFVEPGRARVRQIFFRVAALGDADDAETRARAAVERLRAGEPFATLRDALGDPEPSPLPDTALSAAELRELLGPTVARTILNLTVDDVSDPIRSGTGFHVVQVVERAPDAAPPLSEIRDDVVAVYRRSRSEETLRAYLDELRRQADIEIRGR
jgi:peptidylprolyl isomerase